MKKKYTQNFTVPLYFFYLMLIPSCEYKTSEIFDVPVVETVGVPSIKAVDLNFSKDTIHIDYGRNVQFKFDAGEFNVLAIKFYLNDVPIQTVMSGEGEVYFEYDTMSSGEHRLNLELYTNSGTGSIADSIGAEGYVIYKTWVLYVDRDYENRMYLSDYGGFLKISWEPYGGSDIRYYILRGGGSSIKTYANYFVDTLYYGQYKFYTVDIERTDGTRVRWAECSVKQIQFGVTKLENNDLQIIFKQPEYAHLIESYSVVAKGHYETKNIFQTNEICDTSFIVTGFSFGEQVELIYTIIPKYESLNGDQKNYVYSDYTCIGNDIFPNKHDYDILQCVVNEDDLVTIVTDSDSIYQYSFESNQMLNEFGYSEQYNGGGRSRYDVYTEFSWVNFSPNKNYFTTRLSPTFKHIFVNSSAQDDFKIINPKDISEYTYGQFLISDIETGILNRTENGFFIYDFKTESLLSEFNIPNAKAMCFSSNGNYLFYMQNDTLCLASFDGVNIETLWRNDKAIKYPYKFGFHPYQKDKAYILDENKFSIYACPDFTLEYNFYVPSDAGSIDFVNGMLSFEVDNELQIYDIITGTLLFNVNVDWRQDYYVVNNRIVSSNGLIYNLSNE